MLPDAVQMWVVLGIMVVLVALLITDKFKPYMVFTGAAILLMIIGILDAKTFLGAFANESIVTIFVLILITAALNVNFNIIKYLDTVFTKKNKPRLFTLQLTTIVSLLSGFVNNTPIVALLIPYILKKSKKMRVAPAKFLMPLSFAALNGGMLTIIGTSTNLVLNGFIESKGEKPLAFFDFLVPGLIISALGVIFFSTIGYKLIKSRKSPIDTVKENLKEYLVEISLSTDSHHLGKTITQAGLRNLQGVYLVEILRNEHTISPVSPDERLMAGDRLFFAGDTTDIVEIVKEGNGFQFHKVAQYNLGDQLEVVETMIPYNSNLSGNTLKESNFRENYDAAVIAIHRNGERLSGKLGEITLETGDLLMLTAGKNFRKLQSGDANLYLLQVKDHLGNAPKWKTRIVLGASLLTLLAMTLNLISFFVGITVILGLFVFLRLLSKQELLKNLNLDLLLTLGSAIALGIVFIETNGAKFVSDQVIGLFSAYGTVSMIIGIYLLTVILTSFITNAAAVSIVFPIAFEMTQSLGVAPDAIYMAIAFGASCSFLTPFGYQTNLMIYTPGGYKFNDFLRVGTPMTLLYSIAILGYIFLHFKLL